jgi:hypothetical protein
MAAGAAAVLAALALYGWLLFENLRRARGMPAIRAYGWAALACLAATLVLAGALVLHYAQGLALERGAVASAHLVLAGYGFMGLLALGLSCFLLPMFALAPPPSERLAVGTLMLAVLAIALSVTGSLFRLQLLVAFAASFGLAAACLHVFMMERSLGRRLRPPLGRAFLLVRVSWGCLIASLVIGFGLSLEIFSGTAETLFVVLLVPGWLATFLAAVLQRIVPFLASVHAGGAGLVSAMTPERILAAHRRLHLAALAILAAGAGAGIDWLARAGALAALAAALLYAAFFTAVMLRLRGGRSDGRPDVLQPTH